MFSGLAYTSEIKHRTHYVIVMGWVQSMLGSSFFHFLVGLVQSGMSKVPHIYTYQITITTIRYPTAMGNIFTH